MKYYLAVDIGASSGRHILGHMEDGNIVLEEMYRFPNGQYEKNGVLCWDREALFGHIVEGIKRCFDAGKPPYSVGIDTWGVDFVLLDQNDQIIGDAVGYRDGRTKGMDKSVNKVISDEELYSRTGIQKQLFNTIYQLEAIKNQTPEHLNKAKTMLMIPDYFSFLLTGVKHQEYTIASTTGLLNAETCDWDFELIEKLGYPKEIFLPISQPGETIGQLKPEIQKMVGGNCLVVHAPAHDTASAVLAVPTLTDDTLYISSGTWSLMGTELSIANCSETSRKYNFTNEGGYGKKYRFLSNIMGLWMIQSVRREIEATTGKKWGFDELCEAAEEESKKGFNALVDCDDARFLAPKSMIEELKAACKENGQKVPKNDAQLAATVYQSLAVCYAKAKAGIEEITGKKYSVINIVGGGSQETYLDRLAAKECKCEVCAGPKEATAIGNLVCQMLADKVWETVKDAKKCIQVSFKCKTYK